MPQIVPIRGLKKTAEISQICEIAKKSIFVVKNGYGSIVIMSMKMYEERMLPQDVYARLHEAEKDITAGRVLDDTESMRRLKEKHGQ